MQTVLARSRQEDGVMWRLWPFLYALLPMGLTTILLLDIFGYRYAAQYLWLRTAESLSVVLFLRGLAVVLVLYVLQRLVDAVLRASRPAAAAKGAAGQVHVDDLAGVRFVIKTILTLCAAGLILEIWGFPVRWLITGETAVQLATRAAVIGLAVVGALLIVQMSKVITGHFLQPRTNWRGQRREAGRQLKTVIPLVQTVIGVVVVFLTGLVVLEQIGVETGPILAGVGIFGLAVGFASQSLIKDVINGLFILFEDSISLGDIVELRGVAGEVEKFTLRAVTLRDLSGNVHVIPNSAFDMVTNMTKTFSRYLLDVGVAYRENVDEVIAILREIDAEMRQDPTFGQWIIAPIDILGLDRFEDSAVIIRARLITRRVKQWEVGREFNRRMKAVFDQRGIEIPFPHQTIYWGQPKEGPPLPLHLVTSGTPRAQSQERIEAARSNAVVQPFDQDANGHDSEAKMKK
jgi:small conductance mechanosensitive channel